MSRRVRLACAAIAAGAVLVVIALVAGGPAGSAPEACTGADALDFRCHERRALQIRASEGAASALRDLADGMRDGGYVRAACHQLTHRIGRAAGAAGGIGAFAAGDPVCGSGYYHGVVEAVMAKLGAGPAVHRAEAVCAPLGARGRRSAARSDCVHGMGHGFMGILDRRINASLNGCDGLRSARERDGCYSGVFMENHATVGRRRARSLRPDQPLYPCNAVGRRYRGSCYERQTTYALFVNDGDFDAVFRLCAGTERAFRGACHRGLGGDVAAETKDGATRREQARARRRLCLLAGGSRARSDCVTGAVGVILQDLEGGPAQLDAFCAALEAQATQPEHAACLRAGEKAYRELLAQQTGSASGGVAAAAAGLDFKCHLKKPGGSRRAM